MAERRFLKELYTNEKGELDISMYHCGDKRYTDEDVLTNGFSVIDTWNLDVSMIEALYERLKLYLEVTAPIINLEIECDWGHISQNGKTQIELIETLIKMCEEYLLDDNLVKETENSVDEIWDLWKVISPAMWW